MNYKYKRIEVSADEFFPHRKPWPDGVTSENKKRPPFFLDTPKGKQKIRAGDWVIRGPGDNVFIVDQKLFYELFERV